MNWVTGSVVLIIQTFVPQNCRTGTCIFRVVEAARVAKWLPIIFVFSPKRSFGGPAIAANLRVQKGFDKISHYQYNYTMLVVV